MKNSAFIKTEADADYIDIFTEYGISFLKGSYLMLLNTAKAKEYPKNDSRLSNGVQVLASAQYAKRESKNVSLVILLEANSAQDFSTKYEAFTDKIASGLFLLKIPSRKRIFKLVYTDIQPKTEFRNFKATFTLSLMEPNPKDRIILD